MGAELLLSRRDLDFLLYDWLDAPALTVVAKFDEGKKEERVSFGKSGKDVYAATVDSGAAKIDADRFTEAIKTLDELSK